MVLRRTRSCVSLGRSRARREPHWKMLLGQPWAMPPRSPSIAIFLPPEPLVGLRDCRNGRVTRCQFFLSRCKGGRGMFLGLRWMNLRKGASRRSSRKGALCGSLRCGNTRGEPPDYGQRAGQASHGLMRTSLGQDNSVCAGVRISPLRYRAKRSHDRLEGRGRDNAKDASSGGIQSVSPEIPAGCKPRHVISTEYMGNWQGAHPRKRVGETRALP